jgi:hypothetical protein
MGGRKLALTSPKFLPLLQWPLSLLLLMAKVMETLSWPIHVMVMAVGSAASKHSARL